MDIIRQRIDATGVSESEINTQGANNIVVSIPGKPDQQTISRIEAAAKLTFRPCSTRSGDRHGRRREVRLHRVADAVLAPASLPATPTAKPTNASDLNWASPRLQDLYTNYNCKAPDDVTRLPDDQPLVTCDQAGTSKFILGPVEVSGADISNATRAWRPRRRAPRRRVGRQPDVQRRGHQGLQHGDEPSGQAAAAAEPVRDRPRRQRDHGATTNSAITNGKAQISGSFTAESAKTLADQLKYGALPINFKVQSNENISPPSVPRSSSVVSSPV